MRHIVIPAKDCAENLHLCLKSLASCAGIENYIIDFHLANVYDPELDDVIGRCVLSHTVQVSDQHGLDRDAAEALKAAALGTDWFVLVCSDMIVSPDFLRTAEYVAEHFNSPDLLTLSFRGVRLDRPYNPADEALLLEQPGILSLLANVIFSPAFNAYAVQYLTEEYYGTINVNPPDTWYSSAFYDKYFPEYGRCDCGLDGLLRRVELKHKLRVLKTVCPRSSEIGWYGVHKQQNHEMYERLRSRPLLDRIVYLEGYIANHDLGSLFPQYCRGDYFELVDCTWDKLKIVEDIK